jgi:hypothetical protein
LRSQKLRIPLHLIKEILQVIALAELQARDSIFARLLLNKQTISETSRNNTAIFSPFASS